MPTQMQGSRRKAGLRTEVCLGLVAQELEASWGDIRALSEEFLKRAETTRVLWDAGPLPKGGSGMTVNNNNYRLVDGRLTLGVTWRMVCDVGNWDACVTINSPGQSGNPDSAHYKDLFPLWANEEYVPMLARILLQHFLLLMASQVFCRPHFRHKILRSKQVCFKFKIQFS